MKCFIKDMRFGKPEYQDKAKDFDEYVSKEVE